MDMCREAAQFYLLGLAFGDESRVRLCPFHRNLNIRVGIRKDLERAWVSNLHTWLFQHG